MTTGARTPEELDQLLEDAFVTRDAHAVASLFADGAVLVLGAQPFGARGADEISGVAAALLEADATYVAAPQRVVQAGDVALVIADDTISVVRRHGDGAWAYAIAVLALDPPTTKEAR